MDNYEKRNTAGNKKSTREARNIRTERSNQWGDKPQDRNRTQSVRPQDRDTNRR